MNDSNNTSEKSLSTSDRIGHIDVAKAIGMILIIFSHVWVDGSVVASSAYVTFDSVINSFYVPLFFLLSGVFDSKEWTLTKFVNRSLTLIKYIIIFGITGILTIGLLYSRWELASIFRGSLCWFLITLLWINVLNIPVRRYRYGWGVIAIYIVVGCYLSYNSRSLLYLGNALVCYPFFVSGYFLRKWAVSMLSIRRIALYGGGGFWFGYYSIRHRTFH